jgi:hypothetical protein
MMTVGDFAGEGWLGRIDERDKVGSSRFEGYALMFQVPGAMIHNEW